MYSNYRASCICPYTITNAQCVYNIGCAYEVNTHVHLLRGIFVIEGATFNRGLNRALGSLLAGVLAIVITQIALSSGTTAEPYIIGISIFIIGKFHILSNVMPIYLDDNSNKF